jgi:hypothetical protein
MGPAGAEGVPGAVLYYTAADRTPGALPRRFQAIGKPHGERECGVAPAVVVGGRPKDCPHVARSPDRRRLPAGGLLERAAETVAALARIPSLWEGIATFKLDEGVRGPKCYGMP